jgi:uncharacterized spore protein YtfJ
MDEKTDVALERIDEMLEKMSVNAVFGQPFREGDVTLIPVASVGYAFGYRSATSASPRTRSRLSRSWTRAASACLASP